MVNKLFKVLVVAALPAGAASCGGNTETSDDDTAAGGSQTGAGGHSNGAGGQSSSGGGPTSGGASASGGYQIIPPENSGGMGIAGAPQAPEDLNCPPEQWICQDLTCSRNPNYWTDPGECVCDRSRPVSAEDCDEGLRFVCDYLDPTIAERGLTSCSCVDPNLSSWEMCSSNPYYASQLNGEHCGCAAILVIK